MHVECPKRMGAVRNNPFFGYEPEGDCMVARVAESRRFVEKLTAQYYAQASIVRIPLDWCLLFSFGALGSRWSILISLPLEIRR